MGRHAISSWQHGDTIIEVMVAISVIVIILVGAFALSRRGVVSLQDTQEHVEALKLAQSQVETMRSVGKGPTDACFAADGSSTNNCTFDADGTYTPTGLYTLKIYKDAAQVHCSNDIYTVTAKWDTLKSEEGSVSICYRPVKA